MTTRHRSFSLIGLCAIVALLGGCETKECETEDGKQGICAESLTAYEGEAQSKSLDYVDGANVTIKGLYGDIAVFKGTAGEVSTTFKPFNYRSHKEEDSARRELAENLDLAASADAAGNITISTGRHDSKNGLGSHITVRLPPEFNGVLIVQNEGDGPINQGNIDVSFVGEARTLNVENSGLQNCNILRGDDDKPADVSGLVDVDVRCEADITVRGVNDNVIVESRSPAFYSEILVEIASVSGQATGGSISGDNSSIELRMPKVGDYDVFATASGAGAHIGRVDAGPCNVTDETEAALALTCGAGGPRYSVNAKDSDADDADESFVNVLVR